MSDHEQIRREKDWPHPPPLILNGRSFIRQNLGWIIGLTLWFCSTMISIGIVWNKFSTMNDRVALLEAKVQRMDELGTTFSHYGIQEEKQRITNLEIRMHDGEEQLKRLSVMDEKISRIDKAVDEIRNNIVRK